MFKRLLALGMTSLILIGAASCGETKGTKKISLKETKSGKTKAKQSTGQPVRIAVGAMITPQEGFAYYKELLDYIGDELGRQVIFVDKKNYAEVNKNIRSGDIDVAFVCSGPYADGHDEFGMELLVAPQAQGKSVYNSYIIVPKSSPIRSLQELRGKSFAFTDPDSNSGALVPTYMLAKMGESPESFFNELAYTGAHNKSIRAVAEGIVDGAAVDSLIWEYFKETNPKLISKTRVIEKSPPFAIPPVVTRPDLDPDLKAQLKQIFLNLHKNEKSRKILKKMMIDKFIVIEDSAYDSIREMQSYVKQYKDQQ